LSPEQDMWSMILNLGGCRIIRERRKGSVYANGRHYSPHNICPVL
jgi:hypothetical protein